MPDLLHSLLAKLDRAPAIELPAGAMSAATKETEATIPPPLTPEQSQQRVAEAEAVLRETRTAEKILKTAIATATTVLDRLHATHIRLAGGAELPSTIVAASAAPQLSPSRSTRPTLADTMPSASHRPQREGGLDLRRWTKRREAGSPARPRGAGRMAKPHGGRLSQHRPVPLPGLGVRSGIGDQERSDARSLIPAIRIPLVSRNGAVRVGCRTVGGRGGRCPLG